jgi:hypothetical protein
VSGLNLLRVRIDKKTRQNIPLSQLCYRRAHNRDVCFNVEPAFRRYLVGIFCYECDGIRLGIERDLQHLLGGCHFEVQISGN